MAKQISLSDEVIAHLDRMKGDRSYSEIIMHLLRGLPVTEQDLLNNKLYEMKILVSQIFGDEMVEPIEILRVILVRCLRYKNDRELLSEQISVLTGSLSGALEEIFRLSDQE